MNSRSTEKARDVAKATQDKLAKHNRTAERKRYTEVSEPFELEGKTYRVVALWHGGTRLEEVDADEQ